MLRSRHGSCQSLLLVLVLFLTRDIYNCNSRFINIVLSSDESELWCLSSAMGVVCTTEEDRIIELFREMENRDDKFLRVQRRKGQYDYP